MGHLGASAPAAFSHRHLLGLHGLSAEDLRTVLALARRYARHDADGSEDPASWRTVLRGKVVANLFFEDSTRTRVSFSVAAKRLGAEVIDLTAMGSSVSKGETVADTALNVAAMGVDALVMRHASSGAPQLVVRELESRVRAWDPGGSVCSVVNAGDGKHEHPTQGLLDAYTIAEAFGRLEGAGAFDMSGLKVGIVGDIASSRVARSNLACLLTLGAQVYFIGPPTLVPAAFEKMGARVVHDVDSVIGELDAVNVLRIQFERHGGGGAGVTPGVGGKVPANVIASVREYHERYGLHAARLARLKKGAVVMHPGPINRGVEMTAGAVDDRRSVVLRQVRHGVAVRMAVLQLCIGAR